MAIKYAIVTRKNNRTGRVLAYANPVNSVATYDMIVDAIVEATTVTRADVAAVIEALVVFAKDELLRGNAVQLSELGSLYTTFHSVGTADVKEFTADLIKRVNIRFRPTTMFKHALQLASFEKTITKAAARSSQKTNEDLVVDAINAAGEGEG